MWKCGRKVRPHRSDKRVIIDIFSTSEQKGTIKAPLGKMRNKAPEIRILTIRDQKVVLDSDLAAVYGVSTRVLNQAFRRNKGRFPADFAFRLSSEEFEAMRSQIVIASSRATNIRSQVVTASRRNIRYQPWAFTEHGALQVANILQSDRAIAMSVYVIRAFIEQREKLAANAAILRRLAEIDKTLLEHDTALRDIYQKLLPLLAPPPESPRRQIGFHSGHERLAQSIRDT
jgi:ORF6N domain